MRVESELQEALSDPVAAARLSDEEWVALHVPRFAAALPAYKEYQRFLETALKESCQRLAPLAVVEARVKSVPSFAEKLLRKRKLHTDPGKPLAPDPLLRVTDLCGARVICQTAGQVRAVCRFIEQAFVIDRSNSQDLSQRLKPAEFGYRSVHYVVQCDSERLARSGVEVRVPPVLLGLAPEVLGPRAAGVALKAEIQVRTLLEHASSSLEHDRIYKTKLKVPEVLRRECASVAALLEWADRDMERILEMFDSCRSNFGAWHEPDQVLREIGHARVLLGLPDASLPVSEKLPVAVRAAQLALAMGQHREAVAFLARFEGEAHPGVRRVLGQALVELHWQNPRDPQFEVGRQQLRSASQLDPSDSETLGLRAECAVHLGDDIEARRLFSRALAVDPDPITLIRYLEFETARAGNEYPLSVAGPMLRAALERAGNQIQTRANLPAAWSAVAVAHLFLKEPFAALQALAQLILLCENRTPIGGRDPASSGGLCAPGRALVRLLDTLGRLRDLRGCLPGFDWFERFLLLALAVRCQDTMALGQLSRLTSWFTPQGPGRGPHFDPRRKAVFLAGACTAELEPFMKTLEKELLRACDSFEFDLIAGGTCLGIGGVAVSVAAASGGHIRAFGYLPSHPPRDLLEDANRFTRCFSAPGTTEFTPLDPLLAWTDLVASGVDAAGVRLICYAPGEIAYAECAIALALGARVGVVVDHELPEERRFRSEPWGTCHNLLLLPKDAMTLRAFLQIGSDVLSDDDKRRLEPAARRAHDEYVQAATPRDPSLQSWDELAPSLQLSNYLQVAYWEKVLREYGLGVRLLTEADQRHEPLVLAEVLSTVDVHDPLASLAELEHGRWNVERLSHGWRYGSEKDLPEKRSPWLIPWREIPAEVQQYDLDAVAGLPKKLREVGLEIYRL
jgi:ppGpp synthetase/RelA/SpoT-type nucleotidyltranferase